MAELLERKFNDEAQDFQEIKVKILNQSGYCEGRRKMLMNHVKEGWAMRFANICK